MTNLCDTLYLPRERQLKNFLLVKEVSAYLTILLSTSTKSGIHIKRLPSGEGSTLGGTQELLNMHQQYSAVPRATSQDLRWVRALFYFNSIFDKFTTSWKCTDFHCKHDNKHKQYP